MKNTQGFTLIETMISLVIFGIVMLGIYQTYDSQQRAYVKQQQVIDMQQNQRTAIYFLGQEIRMTGYDPTGKADMIPSTAITVDTPGLLLADISELVMAQDLNGDGDLVDDESEFIRYALSNDENEDGISDALTMGSSWVSNGDPCNLVRENARLINASGDPRNENDRSSGGEQPVANDMDALEFLYVLDDGTVTTQPASDSERARVRSVIVSTLVRTRNRIANYRNTHTYIPASNARDDDNEFVIPDSRLIGTRPAVWGPFDDPYRRNLYITRLRCRNLGRNPYADIR